jgi:hypothetical protein
VRGKPNRGGSKGPSRTLRHVHSECDGDNGRINQVRDHHCRVHEIGRTSVRHLSPTPSTAAVDLVIMLVALLAISGAVYLWFRRR